MSSIQNPNPYQPNFIPTGNQHKKTSNKFYNKEINSWIEKIIKSKKNTFRLTKFQTQNPKIKGAEQTHSQNTKSKSNIPSFRSTNQNNHISNNSINNISNKESEIKSVRMSKPPNHRMSNNQSHNSSLSLHEQTSVTHLTNTNPKFIEIKKGWSEIVTHYKTCTSNPASPPKEIKEKQSKIIEDTLNHLKTEPNLSNIIFDEDAFIQDILDAMTWINFSHVTSTPKYKITDSNYNPINDATITRQIIEEFAFSEVDTSNSSGSAGSGSALIRIKSESWQEILNFYDILLTLLNNIPTTQILISKFPLKFISDLILSINTLDSEERTWIKMIIYKIYISSWTYRKYMMKQICSSIIELSNTQNNIICLNEYLDILKCVILGAKPPIKAYYINIVKTIILPLLKCKSIAKQNYLKDNIVKLMGHDTSLLHTVLKYWIQTWPIRYPERVIIYLDIIENWFTGKIDIVVDDKIMEKILKKIKCCFSDLSFWIADRSLVFFKNENFINLFYKYKLEIVFMKTLIGNISKHWSQEIKIISKIVISKMMKRDSQLSLKFTEEEGKIISDLKFDVNESEDIWDIQFNLKGD